MGSERRMETRFPYRTSVIVRMGKLERELYTEDVSFRGLFVRTDDPYPMRSLVHVSILVPGAERLLDVNAMVVHRVPPSSAGGRVPGSGLQLYGVDREIRARWDALVAAVRSLPVPAASVGAKPEPVRRRFPRFQAELAVQVERPDGPMLLTRDISRGGLLLGTDLDLPVGASLLLYLPHPNGSSKITVEAVVRRVVRDPDMSALGVEFVDVDEATAQALAEIVAPWVPLWDEPEVIDEAQLAGPFQGPTGIAPSDRS